MKIATIISLLCTLLFLSGCTQTLRQPSADLVLLNGSILTLDDAQPRARALAARGATLIAVGSDAQIESYIGPHTRVIDLDGQFAVPGLIDCHGHYLSLGESLMGLDLRPFPTWDDIVALVAEAAQTAAPGAWIVGRGWHQDKWDTPPTPSLEGLPLHHSLSAVSPQNPVMLIHVSGHGVFVNQLTLRQIGYDADAPDPPGGQIVRDQNGSPTGMLRETAQDAARNALARYRARRPPDVIEAEFRRQVRLAANEAINKGITTFHDMGESFATIDLLKTMADEGNLPLRLYVTRKMDNGQVFLPDQKITRLQALQSYTTNAAYASFEEHLKGSLTPGKLADITVFTQNLLTVPENEILNTQIAYTIIAGKIKYQKPAK